MKLQEQEPAGGQLPKGANESEVKAMQGKAERLFYWSASFWSLFDVALYHIVQGEGSRGSREGLLTMHSDRVIWWNSDRGIKEAERSFAKFRWFGEEGGRVEEGDEDVEGGR